MIMNRFLSALLLLLSLPAQAEELLIESAPFILRDDAVALHTRVGEAFPEDSEATVRLVRRFHQGQGWRYLVIIEGAASAEEASSLAALADGLDVLLPEGMVSEPAPAPPEPSAEGTPPAPEAAERLMVADGVLRAAVRAHGGSEGAGVLVGQAQSVRFSYTRSVPVTDGEIVAVNHFLRKGEAVRLEVEIETGTGVDSITTLTSDKTGWVSIDDEHTERDPGRTLEILERFSPEAVLAVPLGFTEDVETAAEWRSLETIEKASLESGEVWVLRGGEDSSLKEALFDVRQRMLRRVTWTSDRGEITFTYGDYQELGKDLIVPFHTRIERDGELLEVIAVSTFEVNPVLDDALFVAPR
jgi:hypothetical protein